MVAGESDITAILRFFCTQLLRLSATEATTEADTTTTTTAARKRRRKRYQAKKKKKCTFEPLGELREYDRWRRKVKQQKVVRVVAELLRLR